MASYGFSDRHKEGAIKEFELRLPSSWSPHFQERSVNRPFDGVLVADRCGGQNSLPAKIQYCYAHLMRDVEKLAKDCPDDEEVLRLSLRTSRMKDTIGRLRR